MQNINSSKNVNRRGRFYLLMGLFVTLGGLFAVIIGVLLFLLPVLGTDLSTPVGICLNIFGFPLTFVGLGLMFRGSTLQKDNPLAYEVGESMRSFLGSDARYTYVRNLSRRTLGYIDGVLVGPPGVLVLRTVDHKGEWHNERAEWRVRDKKGRLRPASDNPTRECARDVYALRKFLAKRGLDQVPVYGVVVFVSDRVKLRGQGSIIPIAEKHTLFQILSRNYLSDERIKSPKVRATVDALVN
ncbi:MAG: NERD domain-containing protein [Chloroflexi bacterium]|nr:NERD domain-containing protein [Chloroflexota bacterium]